MTIELKAKKSRNVRIISLIIMAISIAVMAAWLSNSQSVLSGFSGDQLMDFTSAVSFFLLSLGVLTSQKKSNSILLLSKVAIVSVLIISVLSIGQYLFNYDNVVNVFDLKLSSRLPFCVAICFLLIGGATWGMHSKSKVINKITQYILLAIIILNFASIVAFVLNIPGNNADYLIPIPILTSVILFWYAGFLSLNNATKAFNNLLFGNYQGSSLLRTSGPFVFSIIMLEGLVFLYLINHDLVEINGAFIVYSILAMFLAMSNVFIVALRFNTTEHDKLKYEKALYASIEEIKQYKEALDSSSLIDITNVKGEIIAVNDKFCEVSTYDRDELIGKSHRVINSGFHSKEFFKNLWGKIKKGEIWVGVIKNKSRDGKFYWVNTSIVPFKNDKGEIYQFLTIRQDITKHTLLTSQYGKLEIKNKELEQFTYIASHDLQEPLRTVRSLIDILQSEYAEKLDEEANMSLDFMVEATDRMSDLVKGLLDYSRIGKSNEMVIVNTCDTIKDITKDLSNAINRQNASITLGRLPTVKVFKTEIRLLFQNLISNAIKFQKEGVKPKVHISAEEDDVYWKFSVQDNGIGIPENEVLNVFGIFKRLNKRSNYEGTGIGLAHCEKIVHMHGGLIWVESKENEGSTFHFTILKNLF